MILFPVSEKIGLQKSRKRMKCHQGIERCELECQEEKAGAVERPVVQWLGHVSNQKAGPGGCRCAAGSQS